MSINKKFSYSNLTFIKDLLPFIKPYKGRIIVASLLRIVGDAAYLYPSYALALIVSFFSTYKAGDSIETIKPILIFIGIAICVRYIFGYYSKKLAYTSSEKMLIDGELQTIEHMFKLDLSWHEHENTGNKLKKITRGSASLDRMMRLWIGTVLGIIVNFVGVIFIFAKFDTTILILTLVFMMSYYGIARYYNHHASKASQAVNIKEEDVEGLLYESLNNVRSVKVLSMSEALLTRITKETNDLYSKIKNRIFWFQSSTVFESLWAQGFRLLGLAIVVYGISNGHYEVGFLVLFYSYFGTITQSVSDLSELSQEFILAKQSFERMVHIIKEPITIDKEIDKRNFPNDWKKISLKNVSFAYGGNYVLENLSFDIKRGEKVGIVGLSGSGKSTLFKLLLKEYENYRGSILIDDVSLIDIGKNDYFTKAAAVMQETEVFNFSLKDNIVLANYKDEHNAEIFKRAMDVSHTSDFIHKLPNGVETIIGEKGVKLSGGEKQRLGLARAIFKHPEILFLDEATSHLDIESEEKIRSSLHEFFQTVTAVVIAHRLTTIKEMDKIVVIEGGKLIEKGSFEELYERKGRFFDLWEKQKL